MGRDMQPKKILYGEIGGMKRIGRPRRRRFRKIPILQKSGARCV